MLPTISFVSGCSQSIKALICVSFLSLTIGCATTPDPGSEKIPDASSPLPEQWRVMVKKHPLVQYGAGNWQFGCNGKAFQSSFRVKDDQVVFSHEGKQYTAPLSDKRKFKISIPLDAVAKTSSRSDSTIHRNKRALIFTGSLRTGKGRFTVGIEEFGYQGCTAKASYAPV